MRWATVFVVLACVVFGLVVFAGAAFVAAALKLCEKPFRISRRKTRACVINTDSHKSTLGSCRDSHTGSCRCVLDDILKQIGKHLEH